MMDWIFGTIWGVVGTAGLIVAASVAVAYFVKPWRPYAIAVGTIAVSIASAFARGYTARGRVEKQQRDEAVKKAQAEYGRIDARPDTPADVERRLRDGGF